GTEAGGLEPAEEAVDPGPRFERGTIGAVERQPRVDDDAPAFGLDDDRRGADAKGALVGDEVRRQPGRLRQEPRRGLVLRQDEVEARLRHSRDDRVANGPSARGDGAHARTVGAGDRPESKGRKPSALRVASAIAGRSTGERKAMRRGTQRGRNFSLNRRSVSIC